MPSICAWLLNLLKIKIHAYNRQLQLCLNKVNKWVTKNGFNFSKEKTKCVHFCQRQKMHIDPILRLNNNIIPVTDQYKYLGIIFEKNPYIHITQIFKSKMQLLRILAYIDWGADKNTKLKFYYNLIISKLDYRYFIYGSNVQH